MGALDHLPPPLKRHRMTAAHQQMGTAGVLPADLHVELIDGEIIEMAPIGSRHWAMVNRLDELLRQTVSKHAIVSTQSSFRLDDFSEPQPDLALFRRRDDFYAGALPTPVDTLLVVEVADSSARYDREVTLPLYARRGEVSATPTPGVVGIATLQGVAVDLTGLFG